MGNKLGIDLGGTKIEAIIINDAFQVIERKRVATNRDEGY
ncbi:MAG: ROK family protein, partial [Candidatus Marinimicrobia bacterium]|nr:ROK family protein [Candidatus Neomarinimicrobiota bacterium]